VSAIVLLTVALPVVVAATSAAQALYAHRVRAVTTGRLRSARPSGHAGSLRPSATRPLRVGALLVVAALVLAGPAVAVLVGAATGLGFRFGPSVVARHRLASNRDADALAEAVDVLARALRAGVGPADALRSAADASPRSLALTFALAASAVDRGVPLRVAMDRMAADQPTAGVDLVATALAVTVQTGGDPARSLAAVADTLRERRALRREVRALSSQARVSAAVIALAPAAFALVAAASDDPTASVLLGTPLGLVCLVVGLGLDVAGWWWMDRITRSVS
jgi:tight adherence protein B